MSERPVDLCRVNCDGRVLATSLLEALVDLREAGAAFLRYLDSVHDHLERGDVEVAGNILSHQERNLRAAIELSGPLSPDGYATRRVSLDVGTVHVAEGDPDGEPTDG